MHRTSRAAVFLLAPLLASSGAYAYDQSVRKYCREDYLTHCSQHELGSETLRTCMRRVGRNLSPACIHALVESGEVEAQPAAAVKPARPAAKGRPQQRAERR